MLILNYLMIGVVFSFILDLILHYMSNLIKKVDPIVGSIRVGVWDLIIITLFWPIAMIILLYNIYLGFKNR